MPQVDEGGRPVILYTGVVKRPGVPPVQQVHSLDVSRLCVETQLAAVAADQGELPGVQCWCQCCMSALLAS